MSDFAGEVRQALENIPHDSDCGDLLCDCGEDAAYEAFKAEVDELPSAEWIARVQDWGATHGHTAECRTRRFASDCCSREARIAAAVARAIEASYRAWRSQVPGDREQTAINAALQALGEAPRP